MGFTSGKVWTKKHPRADGGYPQNPNGHMIRQIASSTGQSAQMLRAISRGHYVLDASTLVYDRSEDIDQMAEPHVYGREDEDRRMYAERITNDARTIKPIIRWRM